MKRFLICIAMLAGCQSPVPQSAATPTFDAHCLTCKQCGGGLLDENGEEQGLCEEGFRLWQADLRAGKGL
jgi:nitrous oxide reductase accessory protein NosL